MQRDRFPNDRRPAIKKEYHLENEKIYPNFHFFFCNVKAKQNKTKQNKIIK